MIKYREETLKKRAYEISESQDKSDNAYKSLSFVKEGAAYVDRRVLKPTYIHVFINNISFPKTLDELRYFIYENGQYNVEDVLHCSEVEWTVPRWAVEGDVCLFMHSEYAFSTISALKSELVRKKDKYNPQDYDLMMEWLEHGKALHKKYGGKVFAIAEVIGSPEVIVDFGNSEQLHWSSKVYAIMGNICVLENPIDISEFRDFIFVSRQSAITQIFGQEYAQLKKIIS